VQLTDILYVLLQICISTMSDFPGYIFGVYGQHSGDRMKNTVLFIWIYQSTLQRQRHKMWAYSVNKPSSVVLLSDCSVARQRRSKVKLTSGKKFSWDSCAGKTVAQAKCNIRRCRLCWQNSLLDCLLLGYTWHYASIGMSHLNHLLL